MKQLDLSPRLAALAALVPAGARLADVGTDPAYLPVWLLFFLLCCLQVLFHLNRMNFDIPAQLDGVAKLPEFLGEGADLRGVRLIAVELLALL